MKYNFEEKKESVCFLITNFDQTILGLSPRINWINSSSFQLILKLYIGQFSLGFQGFELRNDDLIN